MCSHITVCVLIRVAVHLCLLYTCALTPCLCFVSACSTASSVTVRSTIRRLREQVEA